MDVETLARHAAAMGLAALENVAPKDWPILKRHGLVNAMTVGHGFVDGMNHKENHAMCIAKLTECIEANGAAGFPNVITFSGMRRGMPDDVGLDNTVLGLKQVIGLAERKKVNLCLEVLNSRVNVTMKGHPDYMCDKVEWAAEVCQRIGSQRMKILFDIYHVQIMQGDIITRIRQYHPYIGHYHLAGVPGRNEMDDTQELNYPAIPRDPRDRLYRRHRLHVRAALLGELHLHAHEVGNQVWRDCALRQHHADTGGAIHNLPDRHGHRADDSLLSRNAEHSGQRLDFSRWCSGGWQRQRLHRRRQQKPCAEGAVYRPYMRDGRRLHNGGQRLV